MLKTESIERLFDCLASPIGLVSGQGPDLLAVVLRRPEAEGKGRVNHTDQDPHDSEGNDRPRPNGDQRSPYIVGVR